MSVVEGTGDVFRDLGVDNPGLRSLRTSLAAAVLKTLDERSLTVRAAEAETGVPAADFSRIRNVRLERFSVDRLSNILWKLGLDMDATLAFGPRARPVDR